MTIFEKWADHWWLGLELSTWRVGVSLEFQTRPEIGVFLRLLVLNAWALYDATSFRAVRLPFNVQTADAFTVASQESPQGHQSALQFARGAGLDVVASASLAGGEGSILGTLVGAIFIATLINGLVILNVSSFWQQVLIGVVIIAAVWLDNIKSAARR